MSATAPQAKAPAPIVLVVDDEPDNLTAFTFNFGSEFRVATAPSARDAWPILDGPAEVAVVIADQRMPEQSGLDFLTEVSRRLPSVRRILLTAYSEPELLIDAINRGVLHRFVTKPWEYVGLRQDIASSIEAYTLNRDNGRLRADLTQASKLAAIGELASSLAHDLVQPLTAMKGYVGFLEDMLDEGKVDPTTLDEAVKVFRKGAETMDRLVTHMRDFARRSGSTFTPVAPETVIDGAVLLVRDAFLRADVDLVRDIIEPLPLVRADQHQLEQVILNLLINARDACTGRPERRVRLGARAALGGNELVIEVEDTGGGVPPDIADRIFEAFFTTKPLGKGTGLGLSISKQIVQNHGGTIAVENRGGGATFELRLPLRGPGAAAGAAPSGASATGRA